MLIKQESITFGKMPIVFLTKVNWLYLLYSTAHRCCFLHLIKQNCLLKTFLRTLICQKVGLDCIPVVVLKNCEPPDLSYILAELFNKCQKESCFPDCWKVSSVVPVFKNVGERSTAKNYRRVSLLSVVSKLFEKLVNDRIVDHLEKCGLFSDFQYGFRSSRSTADLLTVVSDRIARAFNRSGATQAVAHDISKGFDRVWHAVLLKKHLRGSGWEVFTRISS